MTRNTAGNNKFLKQYNQTAILDLIREHGRISRAELSKITGLSPTAIGVIAASLLEKGYIHETGIGESKGGRRPVLLELKPESFYSIGVDLDVANVNLAVMDISGRIMYETTIDIQPSSGPDIVISCVESAITGILDTCRLTFERLLGIGFSIPGMVDCTTREIIFAPNLGWENIYLGNYLSKFAGVPLYVENEAMASAICENWIGCCKGIGNFVCINIKSGIGAGIFTGGSPYRGTGGSAGEVGHIVVDESGPRCGCGNYGCLETMASTAYITDRAKRLVRQGVVSSLNRHNNIDSISIDDVIEASRDGDETARSILLDSARYIGIAISNLVNTLNPSKVVIGKEYTKCADMVMDYIKGIVACKALKIPASRVEVTASALGEKASVYGAAIIPLKALFGRE